jgi:hypothetical protein
LNAKQPTHLHGRRTKYFKATLARRAEVGPQKETATMTPYAPPWVRYT